ncbi:MAG: DUF1653 domain-containing protein [Lachnospiraceae bacterium]|nr:DUF1653 domain-containing protein [Lachnospiraceae bacterium]
MRHNPQPQEIYRHFKGNLYQVRCLAKHSETGETMVVYQAMYGDFQIYVRPLSSFMEDVDHEKYPDAPQRYRFERTLSDGEQHAVAQDKEQSVILSEKQTAYESVEQPAADAPIEQSETQHCESQQNGIQEELNIDPLVMQFLDADTYERRLEILSMLHPRIDDDMINTMAVAVDIEVKEGEIEDRYEELKNCLLTFKRYECNRLR